MNKKGLLKIQKIGIGSLFGVLGFIIMSFGSAFSNVWIIRGGIVITTIGVWLVSWN